MISTKNDVEITEKPLGRKLFSFDDFLKEFAIEWRSKAPQAA